VGVGRDNKHPRRAASSRTIAASVSLNTTLPIPDHVGSAVTPVRGEP
jgi:hypothetical protein